jgi:hypothetical protein
MTQNGSTGGNFWVEEWYFVVGMQLKSDSEGHKGLASGGMRRKFWKDMSGAMDWEAISGRLGARTR